jgi:hypothetical protein
MQSILQKNNILVSETKEGGLGDKLLSILGMLVFCDFIQHKPVILFNTRLREYPWGLNKYDLRLFAFEDIEVIDNTIQHKYENTMYQFLETGCSTDMSPYLLFNYINKNQRQQFSFEYISEKYNEHANNLKPSFHIIHDIPIDISGSYGIHLRKTDKVSENPYLFHENTQSEFQLIIRYLMDDLTHIIMNEIEPKFVIVSEDEEWKTEFMHLLETISTKACKRISVIKIHYDEDKINEYAGYKSVLDMFCLSKCKTIFQSVKVSTFSTISALIGDVPVINYSHHLDHYDTLFIHIWSSVITINGKKCYDLEVFDKIFKNENNSLFKTIHISYKNNQHFNF